jgi:hypothetical protein
MNMTQNRKLIFIGLSFIIFLSASQTMANGANWKEKYCRTLHKMASGELKSNLKQDYIAGLDAHALALDNNISMPALLSKWVNESSEIELIWWRQENRATRCFVMSLYLCSTTEPVSWVPDFSRYLGMFNKDEKKKRTEEMLFVLAHRSAIAGLIAHSIKQIDSKKYEAKFARYFGNVQKEGVGDKLPEFCQ